MKYILEYLNENKETIKEIIESKKLNKRVEELKNNNLEILSLNRDYSKNR
jgi:phage repressor protein C with HTH and peptisase S24 domain